MKRKANVTLIGAFVVGGLALLTLAIIVVAGDKFFTRKERAVMHFSGSVYGLQIGAPVVFRGVRVGSVEEIGVFYDQKTSSFSIPVVVELDGDAVSGLDGRRAASDVGLALPALIKRGLNAQLSMQSLLTGLLYVDLDLRPQAKVSQRGTYRGLIEIPTTDTAIQALRSQLEGMDFRQIAEDLAALAASARAVLAGPQLRQALDDLAQITATVKRVAERMDKRVDPIANELQKSLATARSALERVGQSAQNLDRNVDKLGQTSDRVGELIAADSPVVQNLQLAIDEVGRTATALRQATSSDSTLVRGSERALQDLSRAARALRDLAEALEQQPEALLRGRKVQE